MSLRRSQRGRRPAYAVGDIIEIGGGTDVVTAQLLHRVASSSSSRSSKNDALKWLVTFDDSGRPDEEVSESSFGRLVNSSSDDVANSPKTIRFSDDNDTSSPRSSVANNDETTAPTAAAEAEEGEETATTDGNKKSENDKGPGRRRQLHNHNVRIATRSATRHGDVPNAEESLPATTEKQFEKQGPPPLAGRKRGAATTGRRGGKRPTKRTKNEKVVKVEMLTGTLYLYRGEYARAEFIRFF
mmetsp:Transcript_17948/g.32517  ORF Transcript_17948/g.32517 Transcript_17948/m.32517 type:complete len:242 (-) Transcript_17948:2075-2800(-)